MIAARFATAARPRRARAHGHREREARLVLRPSGPEGRSDELVERGARAGRGGRGDRRRRAASPAAPTPRRCPSRRRARGWCRWSSGWPADGALVSVDTWRGQVASAALAAGASMINDVSGLRDAAVAEACARGRRRARDQHTRRAAEGEGVPATTTTWWPTCASSSTERMALARAAGVRRRPDRARPGHRLREDAGGDGRADAAAARARLARLPAAARGVAQGLRRRAHGAAARRDATPARWPRWAPPCDGGAQHHPRPRRRRRADFLRVHEALAKGADGALELARRAAPGGACERRLHDRAALRPPLRLAALRAEPARPGDRRGQRARAGRGDHLRRPDRRRLPRRVRARARVHRQDRLPSG